MPVLLTSRASARRRAASALGAVALLVAVFGAVCPREARADGFGWLEPEYTELYGQIELEGTLFAEDPAFPGQRRDGLSTALELTALAEWNDGDTVFTLTPFYRLDFQDDARSHFDIREFKLEHRDGDWSATVGVDRVFWGKTEVVHLVDIINQTDQVENLDDEDRLGQPMLRVSRLTDIGEFAVFYLPYARERTLPGREGRLRLAVPYNTNDAEFEAGAGRWTPSVALRYSGVFGGLDLGLSGFHGVSRDPSFRLEEGRLLPVYSRITQGGVDAQYTSGATLWKGEAILRAGQRNAAFEEEFFGAVTGGLEHTLFQIADTDADLGLIAEAAWDSRGNQALTAFENDVILGTRLTLNDTADTAVLLTGSVDWESGETGLRLEAERRISDRLTAEIEGQAFLNSADGPASRGFADDSFLRVTLTYYF